MPTHEMEKRQTVRPAGQVMGNSEKVTVVLEMPGVAKDGLEIKVENNELTVLGRREPVNAEQNFLLHERRDGDYYQVYTLDETIDQTRIDAQLSQGVLRLTLPVKESEKPRLIKVQA